ncbi:GntR family transcriptional regulator [Bacillus songklensis]|uniref:GntR family transcriptional regulator n=1 Tax=Bacillus songklensis TaxID=1069116 RepID=A0ABV8B918_9BACI
MTHLIAIYFSYVYNENNNHLNMQKVMMMADKGLFLKIDPNFPLPINVQIKEQIKWLIGIGIVKPGEYLPPTNQLAEHLQLNRNTINWVYTQLRDEGIVLMQKGRGTQVAEDAKVEELKAKRMPMLTFIEKTIQEASEQGFDLEEVILSSFAFIQLSNNHLEKNNVQILFIECREHDYAFYRQEIEQLTGANVRTVFVEDLHAAHDVKEAIEQTDFIVTTLNHDEEVRELLAHCDKKILTIGATAEMPLMIDIAKMEPGSKVGFVCLGNKGGQWMSQRVQDAGISQIVSMPRGTSNHEKLLETLKEADRIYASPVVYDKVKELAPDKTMLYPLKLEKSSEALLKDLTNPKR